MKYSPTDIARQYLPVREVAPNKGLIVESIQHFSGGGFGDSWCMEFVWMILWFCYEGKPPIARMQAVQTLYNLARTNKWIVTIPKKNDLYIFVNDADHAHHIGIVTNDPTSNTFDGIAGNTSEDGHSSNGDRVAERPISFGPHVKFIRLPVS